MANKLTQAAINEIKNSEGLVLKAYTDPGSKNGLPITIGYGTTKIGGKSIKLGTVITKQQAEQYLINDLIAFANKVAVGIKVPVSDAQFGALVSLAYNIGLGDPTNPKAPIGFLTSTLLRKLNVGDYKAVPAQFRVWNKNDGKVMKGLVDRREREIKMWLGASTEVTDSPKPVPSYPPSPEKPKGLLELLIELILKLFGRK